MPLPPLNLDDRTYQDLVDEARALIPTLDPTWTDHNASDPGITLVEMFAWLAEMLIYRANQVPDRNKLKFLKLLNGPQWAAGEALDEDIRAAVNKLREPFRAVTAEDYERLTCEASVEVARARCVPRQNLTTATEAARQEESPGQVSVVIVPHGPRVWLNSSSDYADYSVPAGMGGGPFSLDLKPGDFLYVGGLAPFSRIEFPIVDAGAGYTLQVASFDGSTWAPLADAVDSTANWSQLGEVRFAVPAGWKQTAINGQTRYWARVSTTTAPSQTATTGPLGLGATAEVAAFLEPRRMLTTRLHVVDPVYVPVRIEVLAATWPGVRVPELQKTIADQLTRFLDPLAGGPEGTGWPFGRAVYVAELYQVLETISGVDYVPDIILSSPCDPVAGRCVTGTQLFYDDGELIGLEIPGGVADQVPGRVSYHLPQLQIDPARDVIIPGSGNGFVPIGITLRLGPVELTPAVLGGLKIAIRRYLRTYNARGDKSQLVRDDLLAEVRQAMRNLTIDTSLELVLSCARPRAEYDAQGSVRAVNIQSRSWELPDATITIQPGALPA